MDYKELESERYWSFPASYSLERKKAETKNMIFSGDYLGSKKVDGYYARFIKDESGEMYLQSRSRGVSGKFPNKVGHLPHLADFFNEIPSGTVLLGELYIEGGTAKNVTSVMGCLEAEAIRRQEKDPSKKLYFYIFDSWQFDKADLMKTPAEERFNIIQSMEEKYPHPYVHYARYYTGKELWEEYQNVLTEGGEGVVITRSNSVPAPGKRTARKTLKLKKELHETLDVIIMGANAPTKEYTGKDPYTWQYWQNNRTREMEFGHKGYDYMDGSTLYTPVTKNFFYNWAGSLKIGAVKNGEVVQIGSLAGMTEEVLQNWRDYVGKVAEITAMEIYNDTGGVRHPRFIKWREDLTPKDCEWSKIFG